jgi:hypothetical protein
MSSGADGKRAATQDPIIPGDPPDAGESFRVVLEDVVSGFETADSFAIKFSLLAKIPVSKVKHVTRNLPATIWSGQGRSLAERVLSLIEEAGGKGKIVESRSAAPVASQPAPAKPAASAGSKHSCGWCGFPMKEGETRCGFCMTAVGEVATKAERAQEPRTRARSALAKRLICGAAVLAAILVVFYLLGR